MRVDEPVEETHQVTRRLSSFVHELLTILLPDGDEELVDTHGAEPGKAKKARRMSEPRKTGEREGEVSRLTRRLQSSSRRDF